MNETTSLLPVSCVTTKKVAATTSIVSSLSSSARPSSPSCSDDSSSSSNILANGVSSYQNDVVVVVVKQEPSWHDDDDEDDDDDETEDEEEKQLLGELLQMHDRDDRESSSSSLQLYCQKDDEVYTWSNSSRSKGCIVFKTLLCLLLGCTLLMVVRLALLHYVSPTSENSTTTQNLLWAHSSSSISNAILGASGGSSFNNSQRLPRKRPSRRRHNLTVSGNNNTITFGELAQQMLPAYYNDMLSGLVAVMTDHVMPDEIYAERKSVLETRDLMDVFSPVYPPTVGSKNSSHHNKDMWVLLRSYLDDGYTIQGEFQDLAASHANYTQKYFDKLQDEVFKWYVDFGAFRAKHDVPTFLMSPSLTSKHYQHGKVSRLFWSNVKEHLPRGNSPAISSLHMLGAQQVYTTFQYMHKIAPLTSVLNFESHAEYHEVRKLLRSIQDEFKLFGTLMFPNDTNNSTLVAMDEIGTARKLLGDMNDHYTAYTIGILLNTTTAQEQERLANVIQNEWHYIHSWMNTSDLPGKLQALQRLLL